MSEQRPVEKPAVIGEDGELIQPDTSVDPEAYTEYLATHVHRDPLLFRIREHVRSWGYAYVIGIPLGVCVLIVGVGLLIYTKGYQNPLLVIGLLYLIGRAIYEAFHHDTRE